MEERKKNGVDHLLLRIKDIVLIGGAVYTFMAWGVGLVNIPQRVEASEMAAQALADKQVKTDLRLQALEQHIEYIRESLDRIDKGQRRIAQSIRNA